MSVVVGVPTYRRPDLLRRLLGQIVKQATELRSGEPVAVVVADNACQPEVADLVQALAAEAPVPIHYRAVRERGISQARNALIRGAYAVAPDWDYLVMYDDDGSLRPGCLAALVATARRYDADCAGGPVEMGRLDGHSRLIRAYLASSLVAKKTGPVVALNGAQNTLVARRLVERLRDPWFAPNRGLSGGEDFAFFLDAKSVGARFVWDADAVVDEPLPPQRLTRASVLRRAFEENAANAHTEVEHFGYGHSLAVLGSSARWPLVLGIAGAVHRDPDRCARMVVSLCGIAGRVAGTAGLNPQPYR
ncbi:glycosyltransferase family 2 protein [Arsenicicoccus sp. oral taxon 190]|uniref:glycosyltransferase family 2 protein n=1 Tax=Arsenicicoccus sp. oral taxon 190 TaxID=1658671 RepID=UPI00067A42D5|nr:glycosyltransferase [Arsenicicoccus sp. oral taxon 190]AKT50743.1 hypothetical protein ADJ73_04440 [Arsenicicoccus sp. oral taxon 190]